MARRAELFVRELTDEEAAHLLKQARRGNAGPRRDRYLESEPMRIGTDPDALRGSVSWCLGRPIPRDRRTWRRVANGSVSTVTLRNPGLDGGTCKRVRMHATLP